jgi:hypothetical protein
MGGDDENDAAALSKLMTRIERIQAETGAAILVIHHCGKDASRGPRGSSAIMPAMDLQVFLEMQGGERSLSIQKCKDGADGQTYPYRLDVVQLGIDDEGDPINSCVAELDLDRPRTAKNSRRPPRPGSANAKALEQLRELVGADKCIKAHNIDRVPEGVDLVKMGAWRQACEEKRLAPGAVQDDSEKKAFRRACQALDAEGWIGVTGEWVWLIDP